MGAGFLGRYDAFISYSHSADGHLAPALQTGLQRLAKPWSKRRALEVFRDETGLSVNPDLWASITDSMDGSRWFILLASPEAARSTWVDQEVERWLDSAPDAASRLLPVLTSGTLSWDVDAGAFTDETDAAPPSLARAFTAEPRHIDVSWAHDEEQLDLGNPRWRQAVAEIAAPIHGVDQDELVGEDVRQHRKTVRVRRLAFASLAILTVGALIASVFAVRSANDADAQRAEAEAQRAAAVEQQRIAEEQQAIAEEQQAVAEENAAISASRAFAAQSEALITSDPELAVLLALEGLWPAVDRPEATELATDEAASALRNSLNQLLHGEWRVVGNRLPIDATSISIDPAGARVASFGAAGLEIWEIDSGERLLGPVEVSPIDDPQVEFSPDGSFVLVHDGGQQRRDFGPDGVGPVIAQPASVVDAASGDAITLDDSSGTATWAADGSLLVVDAAAGSVSRRPADGGPATERLDLPGGPAVAVVALPSGAFVADLEGGSVLIREGVVEQLPRPPGLGGTVPAFSPTTWAAGAAADVLHRYDLELSSLDSSIAQPRFDTWTYDVATESWSPSGAGAVAPGTLEASSDGAFLAAADGLVEQGLGDGAIGVPDAGTAVHVWHPDGFGTEFSIPTNDARDVAWFPDSRRLAIASQRGVEFVEITATPRPLPGAALASNVDDSVVVTFDPYFAEVVTWDRSLLLPAARYEVPVEVPGEFFTDPAGPLLSLRSDGAELAVVGSETSFVALLDVATGEQSQLPLDADMSYPIRYSPDGTLLAGRTVDDRVVVVDVSTAAPVADAPSAAAAACCYDGPLEWVDDDVLLFADVESGADGVSELDVASGETRRVITGLPAQAFSLDVAPDRSTVAIGLRNGDVLLVELVDGEVRSTLPGHTDAVVDVEFGESGDQLLTVSDTILLRAVPSGETLWSSDDVPALVAPRWQQARFAEDGEALLAGSWGRTARIAGADPALACRSVSGAALDRLEQLTQRASVCRRLDGLSGTTADGSSRVAAIPPPVVTLPTLPVEAGPVATVPAQADPAIDLSTLDVVATCPTFVDNESVPFQAGQRSPGIAIVQEELVVAGFVVDVDGCYGPGTAAAVDAFQVLVGLEPTGVVDLATFDALTAG